MSYMFKVQLNYNIHPSATFQRTVFPTAMAVHPVMVPITTLRSKIPRQQQFCCWDVADGVRC